MGPTIAQTRLRRCSNGDGKKDNEERALNFDKADEVVAVAKKYGLEARNQDGQTALAWEVWLDARKSALAFIKLGANPNEVVDVHGRSLIHYACLEHQTACSDQGAWAQKLFAKHGHKVAAKPSKRAFHEVVFNRLWEELVPQMGKAKTLQGELIRIAGRIDREIGGNGGINWDDDFRKMVSFWRENMLDDKTFSTTARLVIKSPWDWVTSGFDAETCLRGVLLHPQPIPLGTTNYKR